MFLFTFLRSVKLFSKCFPRIYALCFFKCGKSSFHPAIMETRTLYSNAYIHFSEQNAATVSDGCLRSIQWVASKSGLRLMGPRAENATGSHSLSLQSEARYRRHLWIPYICIENVNFYASISQSERANFLQRTSSVFSIASALTLSNCRALVKLIKVSAFQLFYNSVVL